MPNEAETVETLLKQARDMGLIPDDVALTLDEQDLLEKYRKATPEKKAQMQLDACRFALENKMNRRPS